MFGIIMTTRGSPAPAAAPIAIASTASSGGEATGPEDREEPTPPSGRGSRPAGSPAPGRGSSSRSPAALGKPTSARPPPPRRDLTYIAHPSFHDPCARDAILAAAPLHEPSSPENRFPSREQEAHVFRRMNYLKYLACRIRDRLDPEVPDPGELDQIDQLRTEALELRNRIIGTHLRLVMMVASKHVRPGYDLEERASDGNLALIRRRGAVRLRPRLPLQHLCYLGVLQRAPATRPEGEAPRPVAGDVRGFRRGTAFRDRSVLDYRPTEGLA